MDKWEIGRMTDADPETVRTRDDLASFIEAMHADLAAAPDEWENSTLPRYLDALSRYTRDVDGFFRNVRNQEVPDEPTWELVALLLAVATGYE